MFFISFYKYILNHKRDKGNEAEISYAKEKNISIKTVSHFENIQGKGLKGEIEGTEYFVGNVKLITDLGLSFDSQKINELRAQLKTAAQTKNTKQQATIREELKAAILAKNAALGEQAKALQAKINSLPTESPERLEAERAYLELTSTFKYSKITVADIKSGDVIKVWSKDALNDKTVVVASKIEIRR